MLEAVDNSLVTIQHKLWLYRYEVYPRLSWPLLVDNFPIMWLERQLQPLATKYLKKWAGLTRSANTVLIYFTVKRGGLAVPSLVGLYKRQQSSLMSQLLTFRDVGVCRVATL